MNAPFIFFLLCIFSVAICSAKDFDFFYFVQQWPGSYCNTRRSCCYPTTGKPEADFGIHGLWPNYNSGAYPSNCDPDSPFQFSAIADLIDSMRKEWPTLACPSSDGNHFWGHEWEKHGTCSESLLDQHAYFESALSLKKKTNLLQILKSAGIKPDGGYYSGSEIKDAIAAATGFVPGIDCSVDEAGNKQLNQIYMCVDTSATDLIECPIFPRGRCSDQIEFPPF